MLKSVILIIGFAVILNAKPALDESLAKKFITESNDKFLEAYSELAEGLFEIETFGSFEDNNVDTKSIVKDNVSEETSTNAMMVFFKMMTLQGKRIKAIRKISALEDEAYRFEVDQFTDEEVKIGIMKLKTIPGVFGLADDYLSWSNENFYLFLIKDNFCKFRKEKASCDYDHSDIMKILKTSSDPDEILFYWKEWRERNAKNAIEKIPNLIELFNKLGEKYGKNGKFAWFGHYLDENFDEEMEKALHDLEPLQKELHAYVRHILHQQYGDKVPVTGLIPHHFYEQVVSQIWSEDSFISKEFKEIRMPIQNNFNETVKEIMEMASNFMKSLGLSEIQEDFWTNRVKPSKETGDDCSAEIYDGGNATYLMYCKEDNIQKFLHMHGNIARISYANERKNLSFAHLSSFNMETAIGEAVLLSASTPKYLHEIGHKDVSVLSDQEDMNRLYRMGVDTILRVPEYFVNARVISDVLAGKIAVKDINKHYWDLMAKYVGVGPPVERTSESLDFPHYFYKNIENNQQTINFISVVMGYQVYKSLCEKSGEYVKGDKTHQLHNCNLHNSKEAGATLKHMIQLASKKSWKQLLGTITGDESGMKGEPMLEYYEPLQKWLHKKNTENHVNLGW